MAHDVFISYSTKDKAEADGLCATLERKRIRCWIAPRDILPGRPFSGEIVRAIECCQVLVLVFSSNSNASLDVLREVQKAASLRRHIVTFRIENTALSDDLDYYLSAPHWLDAVTPPMEEHHRQLVNSVRALLELSAGQSELPAEVVLPVDSRPLPTEPAARLVVPAPGSSPRTRYPRFVIIGVVAALGASLITIFKPMDKREIASTEPARPPQNPQVGAETTVSHQPATPIAASPKKPEDDKSPDSIQAAPDEGNSVGPTIQAPRIDHAALKRQAMSEMGMQGQDFDTLQESSRPGVVAVKVAAKSRYESLLAGAKTTLKEPDLALHSNTFPIEPLLQPEKYTVTPYDAKAGDTASSVSNKQRAVLVADENGTPFDPDHIFTTTRTVFLYKRK